jgi:ketosteroid isomerase-like protein
MGTPKTIFDLPRSVFGPHAWVAEQRRALTGSLDSRVARVEAELAIRDLINAYTYFYDAKDIDRLMNIYSDDCVLVNPRGTYIGTQAIRANYEGLKGGTDLIFHHANNVVVALADDSSEGWATAYLYSVSLRANGARAATMGTYVFHVARRGDEWKVIECRITDDDRHTFGPPPEIARGTVPTPTRPETSRDLTRG